MFPIILNAVTFPILHKIINEKYNSCCFSFLVLRLIEL